MKVLRDADNAGEMAETAMADKNKYTDGTSEGMNGMMGGVIDEGVM